MAEFSVTRPLPAGLDAELPKQLTKPLYLAHLRYGGVSQRLSTGGTLSCDVGDGSGSQTYTGGLLDVKTGSWSHSAGQKMTLHLLNENNAASAIVLTYGDSETEVDVYLAYLNDAGQVAGTERVLTGYVESGELTPSYAVLSAVSTRSATEMVPNRFFSPAPNFCNWLPRVGEAVSWGGEKYVLEGES